MRYYFFDEILEAHVCDSLERALVAQGHQVIRSGRVWTGHRFPSANTDLRKVLEAIEVALAHKPDVLIVFRASTLPPSILQSLTLNKPMLAVWLPDDPVLYGICYSSVVEFYDLVLHCGGPDVVEFYTSRHGIYGVNFPFWTDEISFPYVYDPEVASIDVILLGNCSGPYRRGRYKYAAELPFRTKIFGSVEDDPSGLFAGKIDDMNNRQGLISGAMRSSKLGLSIPQYFKDYQGSLYNFEELRRFPAFQLPSRIIQYAASGVPVIGPLNEAQQNIFPEGVCPATFKDLVSQCGKLLQNHDQLRELSAATHNRFKRHFHARHRAQMLTDILQDPASIQRSNAARRATLFMQYG